MVLHLRAQGLEEGDEHPGLRSLSGVWSTLPFSVLVLVAVFVVVVLLVTASGMVPAGQCPLPRLTSSCCDIKSTLSTPCDTHRVTADTQRDTVTAGDTHESYVAAAVDRHPTVREKGEQSHESPRRCCENTTQLGSDCNDSSLMLPPESTV